MAECQGLRGTDRQIDRFVDLSIGRLIDYAMVLYYCKIVSGYKGIMLNERICDDNKIRKIKKNQKKNPLYSLTKKVFQ